MNQRKQKKNAERSYYQYCGYSDGSGKPAGYVFKLYTEDQFRHMTQAGFSFKKVGSEFNDNRIKKMTEQFDEKGMTLTSEDGYSVRYNYTSDGRLVDEWEQPDYDSNFYW